jgi:hypothetical protein
MSSIVEVSQSFTEPVDLATAKQFLRLPLVDSLGNAIVGPDDSLISNILIPGARKQLETALGLTLANRQFIQYEDGFPSFPSGQNAYAPLCGAAFPFFFGYGPIANYPFVGGTQNSSVSPFEKRLLRSPVTAVSRMTYIGVDGESHGLLPGRDFVVDFAALPGRLSPLPGMRWPITMSGPNTIAIYFTAGYLPTGSANEDVLDGAIWQALQPVAQNSYVIDPNENIQIQLATQAVTAKTEPVWSNTIGQTVIDGSARWKNFGPVTPWAANTNYTTPQIVQDPNGNLQELIVPSLTSGGTNPTWALNRGSTTTDNSIAAWVNVGADESQAAVDPAKQITEYEANVSIPPHFYMALLQMITHWYQNRAVIVTVAGAGGTHLPLPLHLEEIIASERILDFGRGR